MTGDTRQRGFSLTETLLAVGTLAIGMMFVAGTFLTGIYFSTISTERTIAAVAAEEAFAKVRLYALDPNLAGLRADESVPYEYLVTIWPGEFLYPSTGMEDTGQQYSWAVLCRRIGGDAKGIMGMGRTSDGAYLVQYPWTSGDLVQCTVFVSRMAGAQSTYWMRQSGVPWPQPLVPSDLPRPVRVSVAHDPALAGTNVISIIDAIGGDTVNELAFINDGSVLLHDSTGQIYRVLERSADQPDRVKLDRPWTGGLAGFVWVVPPAAAGGRNPVIAVYQEVISFAQR